MVDKKAVLSMIDKLYRDSHDCPDAEESKIIDLLADMLSTIEAMQEMLPDSDGVTPRGDLQTSWWAEAVKQYRLNRTLKEQHRNSLAYLEEAMHILHAPLIRTLEVGFRHTPLSDKERLQRYSDSCDFALEYVQLAFKNLNGEQ